MKRTIIVHLLVILLQTGCVSSTDMDQQFYSGIEQGAKDFSEALGDVSFYIGLYEGSPSYLQNLEWQNSILDSSEILVGKSRGLYSIVNAYCPKGEKILCDDIDGLYNKVRMLHGSLEAAIKLDSTEQMNSAIQVFNGVLAHLESMSVR